MRARRGERPPRDPDAERERIESRAVEQWIDEGDVDADLRDEAVGAAERARAAATPRRPRSAPPVDPEIAAEISAHASDPRVAALPWRQREVMMYGRALPEPRLSAWWTPRQGPAALAVLEEARRALGHRYGVTFDSIGFNWYRDGADSVAWHADTRGPPVANPTIAIVSVGTPRPFRLRPQAGGPSVSFDLGAGDLLVMGGACQHRWEHAVPKRAQPTGPRISITFRHGAPGAGQNP